MQLDMTKGKPLPVILQFTIPLVIGNIFQQLYNMADTIIVGRYVGAGALAAVGSTGTIMFLATGFAQGITAGFSILTAQRYGAGDKKGVKRSVANGIILAMIAAAILTLVCVSIMNPLLHLMNTPSDIFQDAYTYIMGISVGLTANIFYNLFSAYLRAVGNSQVPLFFLIFSACLNVGLDLLFIIRGGMGVAGAAWATNLSQAISAVLCAGYIWVKVPSLKPERAHWKIHGRDTRNQLAAGIPMGFQVAMTASGTMIMQSAINRFGSVAVAAYTAAAKLQRLVIQGMIAMGQTMATYGGQNYGAGKPERVWQGVKASPLMVTIYWVFTFCVLMTGAQPLARRFVDGSETEILEDTALFLHVSVSFFPVLGLLCILRYTIQGVGFTNLAMLSGVSEMIARILVSLCAVPAFGYIAVCFGDSTAWVFADLFLIPAFAFVYRRLLRMKRQPLG